MCHRLSSVHAEMTPVEASRVWAGLQRRRAFCHRVEPWSQRTILTVRTPFDFAGELGAVSPNGMFCLPETDVAPDGRADGVLILA
jgi:hypothetical protein